MNTNYPNGWKKGDICVMITNRAKKLTSEYEILGFNGSYFKLKEKNSPRLHHAAPERLFKTRADAVATIQPEATREDVERLRKEYPEGCRVELVRMNDKYRTDLVPGTKGTVRNVDDCGAIHVKWDCHSSLSVLFGVDECRKIED